MRSCGLLLAVLGAGCAPTLPLPMTAGQLADQGTLDALIAYLGPDGASGREGPPGAVEMRTVA
jgi:hypothetical protein